MLTLTLQPVIVSLTATAELEYKHSSTRRGCDVFGARVLDYRVEAAVAGKHYQVDGGVVHYCGAGSPTEVDEVVVASVKVDVARGRVGGDFAAGEGALPGFEGYEGRAFHACHCGGACGK